MCDLVNTKDKISIPSLLETCENFAVEDPGSASEETLIY